MCYLFNNVVVYHNFLPFICGSHTLPLILEKKKRIHNITAKAALKLESEAWVLKKREEHV
jgi:hypothetical protein